MCTRPSVAPDALRALQEPDLAETLEREAEALRAKFEEAFWCDEVGTYALALDGQKKPCRVRTSNAGHALFWQIASQERAEVVNCVADE